jgi:hypothetical protein
LSSRQHWRQAAERLGSVELLAGMAGIRAAGPGQPGPGTAALEAAARAGRLLGAAVPAVTAASRAAGRDTLRAEQESTEDKGPAGR